MHTNLAWLQPRRIFLFACAVIVALSVFSLMAKPAHAAGFSMQTGYYVGNGTAGHAISGLGFQPEMVFIKADSLSTQMGAFKTTAMAANTTVSFGAVADSTTSDITFTSDGFTLSVQSNVNAANTMYTWTAFRGSNCSSSGTFCVGTYTGTGSASRSITSVGFQPDILIDKRANAAAYFKTSSMPTATTDFFVSSTAADAGGTYVSQLTSNGFDVGSNSDTNGALFYFIAFKTSTNVAQGSYTGNATDNRNITGLGFQPNLVMLKNSSSSSSTNRRGVMSNTQHNGDLSTYIADAVADTSDAIQALQSDGFQVGASNTVNESGATIYWIAFGGAPTTMPAGSGTYKMAVGTYTGTGAAQSITGVGFKPDLVLIKDNAANYMVFKTSLMAGNTTAYVSAASGDISAAITSLDSDGFSLGTSTPVNTNGNTYHWQAFGNAYNPETKSGAADFAIGDYYGTGIAGKAVLGAPYQMDFVGIKRAGTSGGIFRTSDQVGDLSGFLSAGSETSGMVQNFTSDGFQLGANANGNAAGSVYRWFGFKASANFAVGSYTGNGTAGTALTVGSGMQPDLIWIKRTTSVNPLSRPSTLSGDATQYIPQAANSTNRITDITSTGITLGSDAESNASGGTYRYIAWKIPPAGSLTADIVDGSGSTVPSPNFAMSSIPYPFTCTTTSGALGASNQRIRISNMTTTPGWTLSLAATDGATALWRNSGNTQRYDYNDPSGSPAGCSDGSDADSYAGVLNVNPSSATVTPMAGCSTSNISLGPSTNFNESTVDSITIASATSGASTQCYWDITGINLTQSIPLYQQNDSYNLNLTLTLTAS